MAHKDLEMRKVRKGHQRAEIRLRLNSDNFIFITGMPIFELRCNSNVFGLFSNDNAWREFNSVHR